MGVERSGSDRLILSLVEAFRAFPPTGRGDGRVLDPALPGERAGGVGQRRGAWRGAAGIEWTRGGGAGPLAQQRPPVHRTEQAPYGDCTDVHALIPERGRRRPHLMQPADAFHDVLRAVMRLG